MMGGVGTLGNKVLAGGGTFRTCDADVGEGFGRSKVRTCGVTSDLTSGFAVSIGFGVSIGSANEFFGSAVIGLGTSIVKDWPSAIATDFTASNFGGVGVTVSSLGIVTRLSDPFGDPIAGDTGVKPGELGFCESKTEDIPGGNSSSFGGVAG